MKKKIKALLWCGKIILGSMLYALGFNLFLNPNHLNAGGVTGLLMVLIHLIKFGSMGALTMIVNLILLAIGRLRIGKKYFWGSMIGAVSVSILLDLMALLPAPEVEPLMAAIYGGGLCGLGLGMTCAIGASTGGGDIIVRLLKLKFQNIPIGVINICFDLFVAVLTGIVFQDITRVLYAGVAIYVSGQVIDMVVYQFDYSKVVMVVSERHDDIAKAIGTRLGRGATFLDGHGAYTGKATKVVLAVVKKQQITDLKKLVTELDENAFVVVQEAHQVLGRGFDHYNEHSL